MKKTFAIIASIIFTVLLAGSALAQTAAAPIRLVLINTDAFYDEKTGITKLVNASKQLETEFSQRGKELQDGNTKLQAIANELQTMQKLPQAQFNQAAYNAKQEEGERLQRELNYKKNDLETAFTKRRTALISPISQDVGKAIEEFAKQKGYGAIFDIAKMADSGALLFLADAADATKEFIAFYNARPATAAAPK